MSNGIHKYAQGVAEAHNLDLSLFSDPIFSGERVELQPVREFADSTASSKPLVERIAGNGTEVYKSLKDQLLPVLAIYGTIAAQRRLEFPEDPTSSNQWGITGKSIIRLLSPPKFQTGSLTNFILTLTDPENLSDLAQDEVLGELTDYPTIMNTRFAFTLTAKYQKKRELSSAIGLQLRGSVRDNRARVSGKIERISQGRAPHRYTYDRAKPEES